MSGFARCLRTVALLGALVAAAAGATQSVSASHLPSSYTFTQVGPPTTVNAGTSDSYTFKLTNCLLLDPLCNGQTSLQSLGAANVVPQGFAVTTPADGATTLLTTALGKSWSLSNVSNVLQLRAAGLTSSLLASESVEFMVTATAPCAPGTYAWSSQAKPSTDFSGEGEDFTRRGSDPSIAVVVGPATHFEISLPSTPSPFAAQVNTPFTVTVTAKNVCDDTATGYSGSATLSGNLAGAEYGPLTFTNGVATTTVTPRKSESARTLTVTDAGNPSANGTSAAFDVFDLLVVNCPSTGCAGSIDNGVTGLSVNVPAQQGAGGLLGLALSDPSQVVSCTRLDGSTINRSTMGSLQTIVPPAGHASPTITVTVRYDKTVAPGTGVANFVFCKNSGGSTPFYELPACPKKNPQVACVSKRNRNGVGDLVITMLITSVDPVGGGYGN